MTKLIFSFRSVIGPTLEQLSLSEDQILKHPDVMEQQVLHFIQMAVFVVYSIHLKDERWLPYFEILMNQPCNALWMWSEKELNELQDDKLKNTVLKMKAIVFMLTTNILPKLNSFGLFSGKDLDSDTLVRYLGEFMKTFA